jgi:hypothetical protein
MGQQGMKPGIAGRHFPAATGSGIAIKNDGDIFLNALKHKRDLINRRTNEVLLF